MSEDFLNALSGEPLNDAALWHARLRRTDAHEPIWVAFTEWLEADVSHRLAYDRVEALYGDMDEIGAMVGPGIGRIISGDSGVEPLRHNVSRRPRWIAGAGLALIAASVLVALVLPRSLPPAPELEHITTDTGETQHVVAADGSVIDVNGGASLTIALSSSERRIQLDRGEASFHVAADPRRPFVVAAGGHEIRDIGTVFDVVKADGLTLVSVEQGKVSVSGGVAQPVLLSAGERFEQRDGGDATLRSIDPAAAASWVKGYLIYEDTPLPQVVADVSRYGPRKIALLGPDSSFRHFSGILKIDSEDAMLERLGQLLSLSIDRAGDGPVTVRAVSPAK